MCGIFVFAGDINSEKNKQFIQERKDAVMHRGPDARKTVETDVFYMHFNRLKINGIHDTLSNQPFESDGIYLCCNGEIYNYESLRKEYKIEENYKSKSDCEIILHLYKKLGIWSTCRLLDGEYAFVLIDTVRRKIYSCRDHLGVRPLFIGQSTEEHPSYVFASEMKAIPLSFEVRQCLPGSIASFTYVDNLITYENETLFYSIDTSIHEEELRFNEEESINKEVSSFFENQDSNNAFIIKKLLTNAVQKRLMSERSIACLLSGGVDSSIVASLLVKHFEPNTINTYAIGLKGSEDLHYAQIVADHLKTNHTSIELSFEEFYNAIPQVIYQIESYDVTTVRASIGQYLISKHIANKSKDRVIFCGDISDELFGGYRGLRDAPNSISFFEENCKLLKNIHYFDVLRSDRCISGHGLEARLPFSDKELINYVMNISPMYKMITKDRLEKYILRKAFENELPHDIIWRPKTAFSDGVSSTENPLYVQLQNMINKNITDAEFTMYNNKIRHNKPYDKEALYYRQVFDSFFPYKEYVIPYYWKQPFSTSLDPSAWSLDTSTSSSSSSTNNETNVSY